MSLDVKGLEQIMLDCNALAKFASDESIANNALQKGADIILEAAKANADGGEIHKRTGNIYNSIRKSKTKNRGMSAKAVTIGVHRAQSKAFYATPVEFGHGGPHPAPPHPFIRPAYDTSAEASYEAIRQGLIDGLSKAGLK